MYEALVRHHDVVINEPPATIFDVMSRIKSVESHKEARRLRQIERAAQVKQPTPTADAEESTSSLKKRSADEIAPETEQSNKRPHVNQSEASTSQGGQSDGPTAADKAYQALDPKVARPQTNLRTKITRGTTMSETAFIQSRALPQTRGHTSYLTFATLLPTARNGGSSAAESNQTAAGSKSAEQEAVPQSQHQELSGDAAESAATSVADPQQKASELPDGLTTASRQKLTREESDALVEGVSFGTPEDVSFSL